MIKVINALQRFLREHRLIHKRKEKSPIMPPDNQGCPLSLVLTWEPVSEHAHTELSFLQLGPHYCYVCSWLFSCHLTCLFIQHARKRTFSCEPSTVEMSSSFQGPSIHPLLLTAVSTGSRLDSSSPAATWQWSFFFPFYCKKGKSSLGKEYMAPKIPVPNHGCLLRTTASVGKSHPGVGDWFTGSFPGIFSYTNSKRF